MNIIDSCDITTCNTITEKWITFTRNKQYNNNYTKIIPIIWSKSKHVNNPENTVLNVNSLSEHINTIINKILKLHNNFVVIKAVLIKIDPGNTLELGPDMYKNIKNSKTLHIPVTSNENVMYQIEDQEKGVSMGIIYNLKTDNTYSIVNSGDTEYKYLLIELFDTTVLDHEITYQYVTEIFT